MKPAVKTLLLWGLLILLFLAIWQFLSPPEHARGHAPPPEPIQTNFWLPTVLIAGAVFTAVFAYRRLLAAVAEHNAAIHASIARIAAGEWDEAERAVAPIGRSRLQAFRRAFYVQRAEIAARRGEREAALEHLEQAITLPLGWIFRKNERINALTARSLRGFLRASAGDEAGARADIAAVCEAPQATAGARAHARMAEARLLDEAGDRAALGALLERERALLNEATSGPERALVRAYQAMLEAGAASVYRQKGDRAATSPEAMAVAEWIARYAPNAAPFAQPGAALPRGEAGAVRAEAPSAKATHSVEAARSRRVRTSSKAKTLGIWVALIMIFLAIWQGLADGPDGGAFVAVGVTAAMLGIIGLLVRSIRRSRRDARHIHEAQRALGAGDLERAVAELSFEPTSPARRAEAAHQLAQIAWRRGDAEEVVKQCDRAFAALAEAHGGTLVAPTAPASGTVSAWDFQRLVAAQRAMALAALGRADEAWAEIAWAKGLPSAAPIFWVRLLERLAARDLEGAAGVIEARDPAITLGAREEVLAFLVLFVAHPAERTAAEAARLGAELRWDRSLAPWIDALAPGLSAAFARAAAEVETAPRA